MTYCEQCCEIFEENINDIIWDENGGYSTKLVKCPTCGHLNIVKVIYDNWFDVNNDERYYRY